MKKVMFYFILASFCFFACTVFAAQKSVSAEDVIVEVDTEKQIVSIRQATGDTYMDESGKIMPIYKTINTFPLSEQIASWNLPNAYVNKKLTKAYRTGHCAVEVKDEPIYYFAWLVYKVRVTRSYVVLYNSVDGFTSTMAESTKIEKDTLLFWTIVIRFLPFFFLISALFIMYREGFIEKVPRLPFAIFCLIPLLCAQMSTVTGGVSLGNESTFAWITYLFFCVFCWCCLYYSFMANTQNETFSITNDVVLFVVYIGGVLSPTALNFSYGSLNVSAIAKIQSGYIDVMYYGMIGAILFLTLVLLQERELKKSLTQGSETTRPWKKWEENWKEGQSTS